jgi:hypothetical protein
MAGKLRIPRSRGALSGLLLILLGAWGALIPFIGPYFHYAYTPDKAWSYTSGRLWLEILPGVAAVLGGFIVLASARRPLALLGAFVAVLGGAWFVVGNLVSSLWNKGVPAAGVPVGTNIDRLAQEELGFFIGLGVLIVFFGALALGRFAVVGVKEAALADQATDPAGSGEVRAARPVPSAPVPAADDTDLREDERSQPVSDDERLQPVSEDERSQPVSDDERLQPVSEDERSQPAGDDERLQPVGTAVPAGNAVPASTGAPASGADPSATRQFPSVRSGGTTTTEG